MAFGSVPEMADDSDPSDNEGWSRRKSRRAAEVNAAFRTRHGAIKINVSIVNSALQAASSSDARKAHGRVMLSSRHGRIGVNLVSLFVHRVFDRSIDSRLYVD